MQFHQMKRREFITLLGGAVAAWPLAARAQQPGKQPIVGFMGDSTALGESERAAAFARRLHDLGWIEGRTIVLEYRWADGRSERLAEIAAEFARLKVDITVTGGTPAVLAAKQAMPAVPIVFATVGDPVGLGLVTSLARPGGNVTGFSTLSAQRLNYCSGSVVKASGYPALRPSSVASVAFVSATSLVNTATTQQPRKCAVIMTRCA
jgi:putative ABC transport system substrate-binding protein